MSNAAVITLQKKKIGLHRVWLDDNFGEAIHVHVDDFRADLSNQEFAQMYSDLCDALNELLRVPGFDCHKINPVYMELLLWKDLDRLKKVRMDEVALKDLKVSGMGKYGTRKYEMLPDSWCVRELEGTEVSALGKDANYSEQSGKDRWDMVDQFVREHGYPYNEEYIILYGDDNVIRDGQHRAACLWKQKGDIKIPVMRLYFDGYESPDLTLSAWKSSFVYQGVRRLYYRTKEFAKLLRKPRKLYEALREMKKRHAAKKAVKRRLQHIAQNQEKVNDILNVFEGK